MNPEVLTVRIGTLVAEPYVPESTVAVLARVVDAKPVTVRLVIVAESAIILPTLSHAFLKPVAPRLIVLTESEAESMLLSNR